LISRPSECPENKKNAGNHELRGLRPARENGRGRPSRRAQTATRYELRELITGDTASRQLVVRSGVGISSDPVESTMKQTCSGIICSSITFPFASRIPSRYRRRSRATVNQTSSTVRSIHRLLRSAGMCVIRSRAPRGTLTAAIGPTFASRIIHRLSAARQGVPRCSDRHRCSASSISSADASPINRLGNR